MLSPVNFSVSADWLRTVAAYNEAGKNEGRKIRLSVSQRTFWFRFIKFLNKNIGTAKLF
jgi:hypothetical protein